MNVLQLIASRNYIAVNKSLIKIIGLEETIILGELASECEYWYDRQQLENGYFYSTIENMEENTSLTAHKQRKALNNLKEQKIIDVKIKGIPAKRYIKINEEQVIKLLNIQLLKNLTTGCKKNEQLDIKNFNGNNNIINKNNNKNNIYNKYGTYKRIKLTDKEYERLVNDYGKEFIDKQIELLDEYVESNNNKNKYSNFNLVLRKSIRDNWFKRSQELPSWFDKKIDNNISDEDKDEIENILKELGE